MALGFPFPADAFPLFDLEFQAMTLTRFSKAGSAAHAMNERTANLLHSQHGVDWSKCIYLCRCFPPGFTG